MGKKIDRAALTLVLTAAAYLFFVAMLGNVWIAAGCALAAMLLLKKLAGGMPRRGRARSGARATIEAWALLRAPDAERRIRALLEKAYPGQSKEAKIALLLRHPGGRPLDAGDVLEAWRGCEGERLILASTASADSAAFCVAAKLARPRVCLLDGARLCALLERFAPDEPPAAKRARLPRGARAFCLSRERAPRRLLFGLMLFATYLVLGNALYLAASLLTLLFAALGFRRPAAPNQLFQQSDG